MKIHKYVEIKQHALEQPMGEKNFKILKQTKMTMQYTKTCGV